MSKIDDGILNSSIGVVSVYVCVYVLCVCDKMIIYKNLYIIQLSITI